MKKDNAIDLGALEWILKDRVDFYRSLSNSVFGFISLWTKSISNIDSYMFDSMYRTIDSIILLLKYKKFSDSYSLLRKYYDLCIINLYTNFYLKENFSYESPLVVEEIVNWIEWREKLPTYFDMSQYIVNYDEVSDISKLLDKRKYREIRDRCNDNVHYNTYYHVMMNNDVYLPNIEKILKRFWNDMENIFIMHFWYLFYVNNHYMVSSDYIDCLEMWYQPKDEYQYYVAPFFQKMFDSLKAKHPKVCNQILKKTNMDLH